MAYHKDNNQWIEAFCLARLQLLYYCLNGLCNKNLNANSLYQTDLLWWLQQASFESAVAYDLLNVWISYILPIVVHHRTEDEQNDHLRSIMYIAHIRVGSII